MNMNQSSNQNNKTLTKSDLSNQQQSQLNKNVLTQRFEQLYLKFGQNLSAPGPLSFIYEKQVDEQLRKTLQIYQQTQTNQSTFSTQINTNRSKYQKQTMISPILQTLCGIQNFYGELTGFKQIIPGNLSTSQQKIENLLVKLIPKNCMGMTLDLQGCRLLLEDAQLYPSLISATQLNIIFSRALCLQKQFLQNYSDNGVLSRYIQGQKSYKEIQYSILQSNIRKLSFIGLIYLIYAIAEESEAALWQQTKQSIAEDIQQEHLPENPYDTYYYTESIDNYEKYIQNKRTWDVLKEFSYILDNFIINNQNVKQLDYSVYNSVFYPDITKFNGVIDIFAYYIVPLQNWLNQVKETNQLVTVANLQFLIGKLQINHLIQKSFIQELVFRLYTQVEQNTLIPGLNDDEIIVALFIIANVALSKPEVVRQYQTPQKRIEQVLKRLEAFMKGQNQWEVKIM